MAYLITPCEERISTKAIIWAFPAAFLLLTVEQIATIKGFLPVLFAGITNPAADLFMPTTAEFAASAGFLLVLALPICYAAARWLRHGIAVQVYLFGVALLLVNVVTHILLAIFMRRYVPGEVTLVLIVLPYALYAFYRFFEEHLVEKRVILIILVLSALMHLPLAMLALAVGKVLV